jgi:hypothetical protein
VGVTNSWDEYTVSGFQIKIANDAAAADGCIIGFSSLSIIIFLIVTSIFALSAPLACVSLPAPLLDVASLVSHSDATPLKMSCTTS